MKDKKFILDACCGGKMGWFNKNHSNVLYIDILPRPKGTCKYRPNWECKPDEIQDFRALPYKDNSFKLILFDPPHVTNLSLKSAIGIRYGSLSEDWQNDLKKGFDECWRILEDYGILIFKWSEIKIPVNDIIKVFKKEPLFGHRTTKNGKTHWFCFMKIPDFI